MKRGKKEGKDRKRKQVKEKERVGKDVKREGKNGGKGERFTEKRWRFVFYFEDMSLSGGVTIFEGNYEIGWIGGR